MTAIRLPDGGLLLHSPVPLINADLAALDELGPVRCIVAPNKFHHLYVADYRSMYPDARLYAAPGLREKQPALGVDTVLDGAAPDEWGGAVEPHWFRGIPRVEEVVLFHQDSRTLLLADLAFNVVEARGIAKLAFRLAGAYGSFGPSRMLKRMVRDRDAARASRDAVLAWDFDRVIVSHGVVLQSRGQRLFRAGWSWLDD